MTSVSHAQPLVQQSRPNATTGPTRVLHSGHASSHSAPVPAEPNTYDPRTLGSIAMSAPSTLTAEHSSQDRVLPAPTTIQASHSNTPSASRIPSNPSGQEVASSKQTDLPGREAPLAPVQKSHPIPVTMTHNSRPSVSVESRSFPSSRHADRNTFNGPSVQDGRQTSMGPLSQPVQTSAPPTSNTPQQNHQTVTTPKHPPANPPHSTASINFPADPRSLQEKEPLALSAQPIPPVVSGIMTSRPVTINKRSNTAPSQYEVYLPFFSEVEGIDCVQ